MTCSKKKAVMEMDSSSDDEELFSYLEEVHEVKETDEIESTEDNKTAGIDIFNQTSETDNWSNSGPPGKVGNALYGIGSISKEKEFNQEKILNAVQDNGENRVNLELEIATETHRKQFHVCPRGSSELKLRNKIEKVEHGFRENQIPLEGAVQLTKENIPNISRNLSSMKKVDLRKDLTTIQINTGKSPEGRNNNVDFEKEAARESHIQQQPDNGDHCQNIDYKQSSGTSPRTDKYYLINEKDWLTLCAKISKHDEDPDFQKTEASPSKDLRTVPNKCKSMFNAFKQYSPVSKTSLKKGNLVQLSPESGHINSNKEIQNIKSSSQNMSPCDREGIGTSKSSPQIMGNKTTQSPQKVEIVYIKLEDGQVKNDSKKPLTFPSDYSEVGAVKKMDFTENIEMKGKQGITHVRQNMVQERRFERKSELKEAVQNVTSVEQEPFVPYPSVDNTIKTNCNASTKPGMQVRFVRINNKLTRVYENIVEEGLDLYTADSYDIAGETAVYDKEQSEMEHGCHKDDSFNFNDSQLVAFPVNAVDPENIIQDDSIAMLTPSKLQMLTPSKLEMFTPSKLDILSPSKLDILGEQYDGNANRSSSPDHYIANPLYRTGASDEIVETEDTIVLKVTRGGELVECRGNENKPGKKLAEPESPVTDSERRSRNRNSHIRNLWKNVKPQKCRKKRGKQSTVDVNKYTDNEMIEIDSSDQEQSSEEDDLATYFSNSKTYNIKEKRVSAKKLTNVPNCKSNRPSCTISIQASFSDSGDDSNTEVIDKAGSGIENHSETGVGCYSKQPRQKEFGTKGNYIVGNKNNVKLNSEKVLLSKNNISKQKAGRTKTIEAGRIKTIESKEEKFKVKNKKIKTNLEVKRDGDTSGKSRKNSYDIKKVAKLSKEDDGKKSEDISSSEENIPQRKKVNTQMRTFFKDINYKQVDFKDFEVTETEKSQVTGVSEETLTHGNKNRANTLKKKGAKKNVTGKELISDGNKTFKGSLVSTDFEENQILENQNKANAFAKRDAKKKKIERGKNLVSDRSKKVKGSQASVIFEEKQIPQITEIKNKSNTKAKGDTKKKKKDTAKELINEKSEENKESKKSSEDGKPKNETLKVEIENKTAIRSCLKKELEGNVTDIKSVVRNDTNTEAENSTEATVKFDDKDNNSLNDEGKEKIEFLEKLFQIKLKEAAHTTAGICKSNLNSSFIETVPREINDSNSRQSSSGEKKSSRRKIYSKQSVKLTKEISIKKQEENIENKEFSDIKPTVREHIKQQKTDEISVRNKRKIKESVECSTGKKPRKIKAVDANDVSKNRLVKNQEKEDFVEESELENISIKIKREHNSGKVKLSGVKRARGRPRKYIAKGTLLNPTEDSTQKKDIQNNDTFVNVQNVTEKMSCAKGKGKKVKQLQSKHVELKKVKLNEFRLCESSLEIEKKIQGPKSQQNTFEKSQKMKSCKHNIIQNNTASTDALEQESSGSVQVNKTDLRITMSDKNTKVKSNQRRPKQRKSKMQNNSLNSESIRSNVDLGIEAPLDCDNSVILCDQYGDRICDQCGDRITNATGLDKRKSNKTVHELSGAPEVERYCENCSKKKGIVTFNDEKEEDKRNNVEPELASPGRLDLLYNEHTVETSEKNNSHVDVIKNLTEFQPLTQTQKRNIKNKYCKRKKQESGSNSRMVIKRKKLKTQVHMNIPAGNETKKEPENISHEGKSNLNEIQDSDKPSDDLPLDLSILKEDQKLTDEPLLNKKCQEKNAYPSSRKLREGKYLEQGSSGKPHSQKNLKSTKKTLSSGKLKSKRIENESWKNKLEDEAFKFDFEESKKKLRKPINVRRIIRNILKSVKGTDAKREKIVKHRVRKEKACKYKEKSDREGGKRLTSESDDAWLSDSGPSCSFPAFKFSVTSDVAENKDFAKNLDCRINKSLEVNENINVNNSDTKEYGNGNKFPESQFVKLKAVSEKDIIEFHHSPHKVLNQQVVRGEEIAPVGILEKARSEDSDISIKLVKQSKESPEMKKNVDKLRALLDKVSEKKVVKQLKFADNLGSSDSEN